MADRILSLALLALALAYGLVATTLKAPFQYDPLGPGAWPILLAVALFLAAAALFKRHDAAPDWGGRDTVARLAGAIIGLIAYAALFEELGFALATTLYCAITAYFNGVRPLTAALFGVVTGFAGYLICTRVLELNLPAGLLPL